LTRQTVNQLARLSVDNKNQLTRQAADNKNQLTRQLREKIIFPPFSTHFILLLGNQFLQNIIFIIL